MMTTTLDGVAIRTASLSSSIICAISQEDLRWAMPGQHQIRRCSSRADADQPLCAQISGPHAQPTNVAHRSLGLLRRNSFDVERVTVVWYTGRRLVGEAAIVTSRSVATADGALGTATLPARSTRATSRGRSTREHGWTMSPPRCAPEPMPTRGAAVSRSAIGRPCR